MEILARRPTEIATAEKVEVDVMDSLSCGTATVVDYTESILQIIFLGNFCNGFKNLCDQMAVGGVDHIGSADVFFGDHDSVKRSLGIDVVKSEYVFVLVNFGTGDISCDYFAKKAIHVIHLI